MSDPSTAPTVAPYSTSIDIDAPAEVVFEHLTTAEGMVAWMGQHAELHPEPGGVFGVDINGTPIRGSYLVVDPPHHIVVSWGVAGSEEFPPGSSRVEFTLTPITSGTRLRLTHSGLPESKTTGYATGWARYLDRLRTAAAGDEPGPDPFAAADPRELFDELAAEHLREPHVHLGRALTKDVLKVNGKIFAFVTNDHLVVKLPAPVAAAMVADGQALAFESGGRKTREWVKVPTPTMPAGHDRWRQLISDARTYVERLAS